MSVVVTVQPAIEPVLISDAKPVCRIDSGDTNFDADLTRWITAARIKCESLLGQAFITQTRRFSFDRFKNRVINIPYPPLQAVSSLTYTDFSGNVQTWDVSNYIVDTDTMPGRLSPQWNAVYPVIRPTINSIAITYTCGYGSTAASVPANIRSAILGLVSHYNEHREAISEISLVETPMFVEDLLYASSHGGYLV